MDPNGLTKKKRENAKTTQPEKRQKLLDGSDAAYKKKKVFNARKRSGLRSNSIDIENFAVSQPICNEYSDEHVTGNEAAGCKSHGKSH